MKDKTKKNHAPLATRLSQMAYDRDFFSHDFANPVRYILSLNVAFKV